MFRGLGVAMVTPFRNGKVDFKALGFLTDHLIDGGVDFLVPCGTTAESPTLIFGEHIAVIEAVVETVLKNTDGRVPVLAGTGSNSTKEAVELTKAAKNVGANGVLVVSPYYNKPMKAGFLDYYRQIAKVGLPVILYDIPGRTGKGVPTDVILELAKEGSIKGIKWASGDIAQLMQIVRNAPEGFDIFSGDDNLTFILMALGGHGVISVVGNIVPEKMSSLVNHLSSWRMAAGQKEHYHLSDLMQVMFLETNPIPVKTALHLMYPKVFAEEFRSPMGIMEKDTRAKLKKVLAEYKLLPK